jgi:hypothetical protein
MSPLKQTCTCFDEVSVSLHVYCKSVCTDQINLTNYIFTPVPLAARSKARNVFVRSNTGIVGSNPARGTDVCPRFSVLCCPV